MTFAPEYIKKRNMLAISVHDDLVAALEALEKLTTACATNAKVMEAIDLAAYDAAVDAEERARTNLTEVGAPATAA